MDYKRMVRVVVWTQQPVSLGIITDFEVSSIPDHGAYLVGSCCQLQR
jgi:hypothetical protein